MNDLKTPLEERLYEGVRVGNLSPAKREEARRAWLDCRWLHPKESPSAAEKLYEAIQMDIINAWTTCGGDGLGCAASRGQYGDNHERRYFECNRCPMGALTNVREAADAHKVTGE